MASENFGLKIGLEGEKEFKSQLSEINQSFKVLGSEMKLVDSQFEKNDQSAQALTARNEVLERSIDTQKQKIEVLRSALQNAASSFGETDKRTQAWQVQLNNAQAELNGMEKELKQNQSALKSTSSGMDDAKMSADKMGDEIEDAGNQADKSSPKMEALGSVCKGVAGAITAAFAAVSAVAIAAGKALMDMTKEGAAYADTVLTEATVTGIATDKLQEYMYAAELIDVSTDTLTKSMAKQIKSMKAVQDGTKLSVEAYEKLGVSALDANGNLRDSDIVYWEVIDALGKMENETERDALAMQILGKSAQELNPLITAGAEKMAELGEEARKAGYVISDETLSAFGAYDDQLQKLSTGATAAKNALGTVLLPILTQLAGEGVDLLGDFSRGIQGCEGDIGKMADVISDILPKALNTVMQYVPQILNLITSVVGSFGKAIVNNLPLIVSAVSDIIFTILNGLISALPQIADGALQLVLAFVDGIIAQFPLLIDAALKVIETLIGGLAKAMPKLIPAVVQVVMRVAKTLINNLPIILKAVLQLVKGVAQGVLDAIPIIIKALPEIIKAIVEFILGSIPEIIDAGIQLLTSLVAALPEIIEAIVAAIPEIISGIIDAVLNAIPLIIDAGIKLLTALIGALPDLIVTVVGAIPLIIQAGIQLLISLVAALPEIIMAIVEAIPQIIDGIIEALLGAIPQLIQAGVTLFMSLIANLPQIIMELVKAMPQIISSLVSLLQRESEVLSKLVQISCGGYGKAYRVWLAGFGTRSAIGRKICGTVLKTFSAFIRLQRKWHSSETCLWLDLPKASTKRRARLSTAQML